MSNPLKMFNILLEKGNSLDPANVVESEDEKLSLFDDDITDRIRMETGIALLEIDNAYWGNAKTKNDYYLIRILKSIDRLMDFAKKEIEKYIEKLVARKDIENWVIVYNNIREVHEALIRIQSTIIDSYTTNVPEEYKQKRELSKYPYFNEYLAIELQKACRDNIGVKDTLFGLVYPKIEVKTGAMNLYWTKLISEKIPVNHAENIKVTEKRLGNYNESENYVEKISNDNHHVVKTEMQNALPIEQMEFNGTVENLGLLYSLMFEVNLIKSENCKSKIGRILARTVKIGGKGKAVNERTITDAFNQNNREFDHKNIPFIKEKLFQMLQVIEKLKNI